MGPLTARAARRLPAIVLLAVNALVATAGPVAAADPVTFGDPSASSTFGAFIEFKQPVTLAGPPRSVELLLSTPDSVGSTVTPVPDAPASGASTLTYRLDLADGHIVPNTTFTARWRVTDDTGKAWTGPPVRHTYDDDRIDWQTLEGDIVRVHWSEGGRAFGQRALAIGDEAVAETAKLLGVTETEPIDFFIYADQDTFYEALGPGTRENVGGQAHPGIRTLFALITPDEIEASWVESVVPHELVHLVFATAVDNPYHDPPHWLNEGLAVYLADGYRPDDEAQVRRAARNGSIIPLDGLAGAFPTTRDRFFLAYAESVSAVDRIVRVNGRDALVQLIRSYADGVSDDEAFQAAIGRDVAGFEADWLEELGAKPPTRLGPRPAPAGPLPEGWSGPQPDPSFEVVGSLPPAGPDSPGSPGSPLPGAVEGVLSLLSPQLAMIALALIAVVVVLGARRIVRRAPAAGPTEYGDNRLFGRGPVAESEVEADEGSSEPPGPVAPAEPPPSRLWTTTDWSLPRTPAGPAPSSAPPPEAPPAEVLPHEAPPADRSPEQEPDR